MTSAARSSRNLAALILPILLSVSLLTWGCRERAWKEVHAGPPARKMAWRTLSAAVLDIWSPDGRRLWAVGPAGFLIHSTDGGATWETRDSGTRELLNVVTGTADGQMIWAAGTGGTFIRSSDRGRTWSVVKVSSDSTPELVGLHGSRNGRAIRAFDAKGWEYQSADGGVSWAKDDQPLPFARPLSEILHVVASRDGRRVVALGDHGLVESRTGGKTWEQIPVDFEPWRASLTEDGSELWLTGNSSAGGQATRSLWHGRVIGSSWKFQRDTSPEEILALFMEPKGTKLWATTLDGRILIRSRSSQTWSSHRPKFSFFWMDMSVGADTVWLIGRRKPQDQEYVVARSQDRGETWEHQTIADYQSLFRSGTRELWFQDQDNFLQRCAPQCSRKHPLRLPRLPGFQVPPEGTGPELWYVRGSTFWLSRDAGKTWRSELLPDAKFLLGGLRFPQSGFWMIGEDLIFHSPEGRSPWERIPTPPHREGGMMLYDLFVADTKQIPLLTVVSFDGKIFQKAKDAEEWKLLHEIEPRQFNYSIEGTPDGRQLWVAGPGALHRSGDSGRNWHRDVSLGTSSTPSFMLSPMSLDIWALMPGEALIHGKATEAYPRVTHARLVEQPPGFPGARLELLIEGQPDRVYLVKGGGERDFKLDQLQDVSDLKVIPPQKDTDAWTIEFDPESQVVGVEKGEDLYAEVTLATAGFRQAFTLPPLSYKPWRPHPLLAGYAAWLACLALLLMIWPGGLLKLQRALRVLDVARLIEPIPAVGPAAALALGTAGALPLFVRSRRALDTWVRTHRETVKQRFEAEETVLRSGGYVPLPARVGNPESGSLLDRPDAPAISRHLSRRRTLIQVVGVGGAGKTMLAVQIARWALAGKAEGGLERNPMLPVLVDEDTADLRAVVKRKLTSWLQEEIGDELLDALLRKQRLLVIVDRVSERQKTTQEHLRTLHGSQPINALVITARQPIAFEAGGDVRVFPQALGSKTLLHFMTSLLQDPSRTGVFEKMGDQLELGKKLADLIRLGAEEVPLTPLPVRLYVGKAVKLAAQRPEASLEELLDELPGSIPDVYFDYLRSVNPDADGTANRMPNEEMLRAAEVLAKMALEGGFVPHEISKAKAREALSAAGWKEPEDPDPVGRLRDNGVLLETKVGTETLLRFALDPVAEFLAAMAHAKQCAGDAAAWDALFTQVEAAGQRAAGFRLALRLVCHAYGQRLKWACDGQT